LNAVNEAASAKPEASQKLISRPMVERLGRTFIQWVIFKAWMLPQEHFAVSNSSPKCQLDREVAE
jgi:hypothetical protein